MKQVLKPAQKEESIYYSDFEGKVLSIPPITITIDCSYGSCMDSNKAELHLTDEEARTLLLFIKANLTPESIKSNIKFWEEVI
jgi:hypothetical protein